MKKFLILIIIIGIIAALFYFKSDDVEVETNTETTTGESFRPDASSATFIFDNEEVVLSKGKSITSFGEETSILDDETFGDINKDNKDDSIVLLSRTGLGSGNFIYIAAYVSGPVSYKGTNAVFLGDRIVPQGISIRNGVITVNYLDREEGEAFAAEPTIEKSVELVFNNGTLEER